MDLPRDLIELFSAFARVGVRYLLVGGHAVAAHGRPRSTKDVDLWLAPEPENLESACRALVTFGVPIGIVDALRSSGPDDIVWLGRAPTRIDLLRSLPGVDFAAAWPRRLMLEIEGVAVPVIGKADLIRNKEFVGRPQDRRDVRALTREATKPSAKRAPRKTARTRRGSGG
ncbi:MAG: hypothetical protein JW940_18425 [Polyangiaceae bacterium]|nr:hypothetical protein [Polyangiaceae bacterium]